MRGCGGACWLTCQLLRVPVCTCDVVVVGCMCVCVVGGCGINVQMYSGSADKDVLL